MPMWLVCNYTLITVGDTHVLPSTNSSLLVSVPVTHCRLCSSLSTCRMLSAVSCSVIRPPARSFSQPYPSTDHFLSQFNKLVCRFARGPLQLPPSSASLPATLRVLLGPKLRRIKDVNGLGRSFTVVDRQGRSRHFYAVETCASRGTTDEVGRLAASTRSSGHTAREDSREGSVDDGRTADDAGLHRG